MLHLFPLSKGLGSAFAWLFLSVSHKGQEKKNKIKGKNPSYATTTQLISTKLSLVNYLSISVLGNHSIILPLTQFRVPFKVSWKNS